jgi:predicted RNA-binding protein with PIN domain
LAIKFFTILTPYSIFTMPLHLIIDGYNLIRQSRELQEIEARELKAGREALLDRLAAYRHSRAAHKITVVFDGWQGGELKEARDRRQGIAIVYSRRGEPADEVIKRLLAQERERAVVVSSDREIQECAQGVGAAWIASSEFEMRLALDGAGEVAPDSFESPLPGTRKKGPARRLPKRQRQRLQRLKKL